MKYMKQFILILFICFLGELCNYWIPLPIPASIYGLIFLLAGLLSGIIKLEQVDETATFLVEIMPIMFIPAGVGLITAYSDLRPNLLAILVITVLTTVLVMGITGVTAQCIMKHTKSPKDKEDSKNEH
jgi:holin-like protein